ncbi:MAG: lysylphosphatidylglycerol synthase transmembrane domain-containing protein [Roseiflexaceae bacterium]|nr:lysylphosphatidylglycerol synthase transmembrane domain-containing protein [Roseiflexaceae bacterium]
MLTLLRIGVALALVGLIFWKLADLRMVGAALLQANPLPMTGCVVIYFAGVWLSCIKWQNLLRAQGHDLPLARLINWYLLGALGSTVLPSSVGGDLGRAYVAGRAIGSHVDAWTSIAAERLTGLAALLALASLTLALAPKLLGWPVWLPVGLLLLGGSGVVAMVLIFRKGPVTWLPQRLLGLQAQVANVIDRYRSQPKAILWALALSLVFQLMNALSTWFVALAIEPQAAIQISLIAPLVGLAGLVPLTPGGLGIREGAMALLLERSGMLPAQAVAAAFLSRALLFMISLSGLPALLSELRSKGAKR